MRGWSDVAYLTAENWLDQTELPEHLAMIGGGYIGLEMGQFYRRMGSRVTVWQQGPRIIEHEDEEVSAAVQGFLEAEGIEFRLKRYDRVRGATWEHRTSSSRWGGIPIPTIWAWRQSACECDRHGYVKVDQAAARPTCRGIWAAGDIRGGPLFTHTSWDDYRILLSQMAGDGTRTTERIVPYAVFTDPELGRVGMTEREAREQPG